MYKKMTEQEKQERREARKQARIEAKRSANIEAEKSQKPVKSVTISIEWKRSRTWGSNPHATAEVVYKDGTHAYLDGFTCSGCGYCKESTVIAEIFNATLRYRLHEIGSTDKHPYGVYLREEYKSYNGGVGTSCYTGISEFIGGMFENVASGKTFDVYKFTSHN